MIDTHAHLDACADTPAEVLARARAAGVQRVITIGSGVESCRGALELANREQGVFAALGIHPHQAGETSAADLEILRELLAAPGAVAVGETGLDYFRDYAPRDRQSSLFRAHVELAGDLGKALVVHTRAAEEDTLHMLESLPARVPVIFHCFSSVGLLPEAIRRGYYVSFAGNVTFPNADDLREAARKVPRPRLLAETDSPYLAPQPRRGRLNEPANVLHVLATLAEACQEEPARLEQQIEENAARAFRLS